MFWFLMGGGLLMGTMVALGFGIDNIFRFSMYASIASPFFLCFIISRNRNSRSLLSHPRIRVVGVIMLISILLSTFATYPITPLYPTVGGSPVLDDNSVNSVFAVSGLKHFASVYSSGNVVTSMRIFEQLMSLHPEMLPLAWNEISHGLEDLSPTQVKGELVIFDAGGESGTATLAMRELAPNLRSRLGIVYTNGFFYLGMAT
jgi:hypothetical protein